MEQIPLLHDDINDALRTLIKACGGTKAVAARLWPEKTIADAQSYLNDCLNPARPAKLSPEQVLLLLKWGRQAGCHAAMNYICGESGYSNPAPIEPESELAQLYKQYIEASRILARLQPMIAEKQNVVKIA